jgi:hypothetical protein
MEQIKIGFTGNRYGLRPDQKTQIEDLLDKYDHITVSHGDCVGSDTDFHLLCIEYKYTHPEKTVTVHIYPPDNPRLRGFNKGDVVMPEKPYLDRNMDIIKNCDLLIACPVDKNKEEQRSGTWSTIRQARRLKLTTYIF